MYPITVGIYAGLFSAGVRGRVESVIMGSPYLAVLLLGLTSTFLFSRGLDWHWMLWVCFIPVLLAFTAPLVVSDDRQMSPWDGVTASSTAKMTLRIAELFIPRDRRQTLMLTALSSLNFFAYQAFSGWAMTYLKTIRILTDSAIGVSVRWMFAGSILGSCFWIEDRFGCRSAAIGFSFAVGPIIAYLYAPITPAVLNVVALAYGSCLACSVVWSPWLTTMTIASVVFSFAALIWLNLPETLIKSHSDMKADS